MDRAIVLDEHDGPGWVSGFWSVETVELFKMSDEVAAALGRAGMNDEVSSDMIKRPQHRHFLGLSRCRHAQVCAGLRPRAGKIGMRQRLAFVAIEKHDIASRGLTLSQLQAQSDPIDLAGGLTAFQRVPGPAPAELFFRSALDNCERLMLTPTCASISVRSRAIVQFTLSATGCSSNGVTTRRAASLFTGGGPGATLAFSPSIPSLMKSPRQRRTVSSRTPNASAIRGLVQPASVRSTARALSASPRSREAARDANAPRCSSLATTGDLVPMPHLRESTVTANRRTTPLVKQSEPA